MSTFVMPSLGADMESAVLMEWRVKEGDRVEKGQVIAEVETSKGVIEIEVFETGIVDKILIQEETECAVGTPMAIIRTETQSTSADTGTAAKEPSQEASQPVQPPSAAAKPTEPPLQPERVKASPAARKKARELGIELSALGSGEQAIHLSNLQNAETMRHNASSISGMRQAIAKAMSRSNTEIPHYYLSTSINMTPALHWLEELNAKHSIRERILPAALLIRAVVKTLEELPELNGFWFDDMPHPSDQIHPGIAIALRKEGLITPALLDAQNLNLHQTMQALEDLITRTRSGKLRSSELTSQTITITNLGDLGVESVYGIIYPPQVALIGFGRIIDAPWAEGDTLSVRKVLQATLAGDHRATDGRTGALFLDRLNRRLQQPEELL